MLWLLPAAIALLAGCGGGSPADETTADSGSSDEIHRQLERNRRGLPSDVTTDRPLPKQTIEQMIRRYRSAGFFGGGPPSEVAARIRRSYKRLYGKNPSAPRTRQDELELIAADRRQAWFEDIERDVIEGNNAYVAAFREWARASRGTFKPRRIREEWKSADGPVQITFNIGGRQHKAHARSLGDFLDLCVLTRDVNRAVRGSPRRFELYRPDAALAQVAFVAALTAPEKKRLSQLGWRFATPPEVGLAFGYGQLYEKGAPSGCDGRRP